MNYSNFSDNPETVDIPVFLNYLNIVVGLAATCFNALVVYAYAIDREIRRVPVNFFIFCLSMCDKMTGISLLIQFVWVQNGAIVPASYNVPCLLWGNMTYTSVLSSAFLVILISWDRLQMVTHPFKHRQFTRRRAVLQVLVLLIYVLLLTTSLTFLAPVINGIFVNTETVLIPCVISYVDTRFIYVGTVLNVMMPFSALVIINVLIGFRIGRLSIARIERQRLEIDQLARSTEVDNPVYTVTTLSVAHTSQPEWKGNFKRATQHSEKDSRTVYMKIQRTIRILLLFVIVYISCWLPLYIGFITKSIIDVSPWLLHFLFIIMGLNSVINPFLYAFMSKKYRNRLTMMLRCRVR